MDYEENGQEPNDTAMPTPDQIDDMSDEEVMELQAKLANEDQGEPEQSSAESQEEQQEEAEPEPEQETAKADADVESDDPEAAEQKKSDTVPHGRFHRENERRKAAENELEQLRLSHERLEQRTQQILEQMQQNAKPQEEEAKPISAADDPIGAIDAIREQLSNQEKAQAERIEQENQERYWHQATEYTAKQLQQDPEAVEAFTSLAQSYKNEYLVMGYSQHQADQAYRELERQHIAHIVANNIDPTAYVKNLATSRGWQPKQPEPQQEQNPADKLEKREEARKASMTLSNSGGATANTHKPSPQQLAEMSEEEFAAFMDKHGTVNAALT